MEIHMQREGKINLSVRCPTQFVRRFEQDMDKNVAFTSLDAAVANNVLPVPGGLKNELINK